MSMKVLFRLWLVALLPFGSPVLAGEEGKAPEPKPAKEAEESRDAIKAEDVTVKLLDPGAEPRRELRYQFQAGRSQSMVLEMQMLMSVEMMAIKQPETKVPATRTVITIDEKSISPEGNLHYEFKLEGIEVLSEDGVDPNIVADMKDALKGMEGISGYGAVTPRGVTIEAEVKIPPGLNPQIRQSLESMRQSLRQLSAPLPAEAVGKGGRWEVNMPFNSPMLKMNQSATYTVMDLDGEQVKMATDMKQAAPEQVVNQPGMPPGLKLKLKSMTANGNGLIDLDLRHLVPRFSLKTNSVSELEGTSDGQAEQLSMKMSMKMEVKVSPLEKGAEKKEPKETKDSKGKAEDQK